MSATPLVIVDYGVGNLFNVQRAFESLGAHVTITSDASVIQNSPRLVLPGVGAFGEGMKGLEKRRLIEPLRKYAATGRPLLGLCLGMQLMFERSEEMESVQGLSIIRGDVKLLRYDASSTAPKVPQIGWNQIKPLTRKWDSTILDGFNDKDAVFYFLHSYYAIPADQERVLGVSEYGGVRFCAAIEQDKIIGFQPHLERSGPLGLRVLKRFLEL